MGTGKSQAKMCSVSLFYLLLLAGSAFAQTVDSGTGSTPPTAKKVWWRYIITPFRPNPSPYISRKPCGLGFVSCLTPAGEPDWHSLGSEFPSLSIKDEERDSRKIILYARTDSRGPFSHHWLEMETSIGLVTIGFGPATIPFIDSGQISLQDSNGNIERISGNHPILPLTLPPVNYRYARHPGEGKIFGKPIEISIGQADEIVRKIRSQKFIFAYTTIFNDCRTFVCKTQEQAKGRSGILCHLLLKGYW